MVWALCVPGLLVFMLLRFYKNIYIKHQRDLQLTPEALKLGIFIGAIITTVGGTLRVRGQNRSRGIWD